MRQVSIKMADGQELEGVSSLPFEVNSMTLDEGVFDGTFTYKVNVPMTDGNRSALGYPEVHELGVNMDRLIDVVVTCDGLVFDAKLQIVSIREGSYGLSMNFSYGVVVDEWGKTYMDEMELGTVAFPSSVVHGWNNDNPSAGNQSLYMDYQKAVAERCQEINDLPLADTLICMPIYGSSDRFFNLFRVDNSTTSEPFFYDNVARVEALMVNPSPCFFVIGLIEKMLELLGYTLTGNLKDTQHVNRIIFHSKKDMRIRSLKNSWTESSTLFLSEYWEVYEEELELKKFLPHVTVLEFLRIVKSNFFCSIAPDIFTKTIRIDLFPTVLDSAFDFDLTDRVSRFIEKREDKLDGYNLFYNSVDETLFPDRETFSEYEDLGVFETVDDLPGVVEEKQIAFVRTSLALGIPWPINAYYITNFDDNGVEQSPKWLIQRRVLTGVKTGQGEIQKNVMMPGWMTYFQIGTMGGNPEQNLENLIYYPRMALVEEEFSFVISVWAGKRIYQGEPERGFRYSAISNGIKESPLETNLIYPQYTFCEYSLFLNGREGLEYFTSALPQSLMQTFSASRYLNFIQNKKTVRAEVRLTFTEMMRLRMDRPVRIGNNLFLVKRIRGNSPIRDEMEVEMWWIDPAI